MSTPSPGTPHPRLCLNMIVKNEAAILERCLASVAPHVACYVIADTGSTDGTQDLIRRFFAARGVPGEVVEFPFQNFEQARNRALDAARASRFEFEYLLLTDADMELVVPRPPLGLGLSSPVYMLVQHAGQDLEYANVRIVRRDVPARYVGVTHEVLDVGQSPRRVLDSARFIDHACGSNRATKFERDIALLTESLRSDPDNARSVFYLANSYYNTQRYADAIGWYRRRIALAGWREEVFYSHYRIALCLQALGRESEFVTQVLETFEGFPTRAEPLCALATHFMTTKRYRLGHHFAQLGASIPKPDNALFVETNVYAWRLIDVQAVCGYYIDRRGEALSINERLLNVAPPDQHERIRKNIAFCKGLISA